MHVFLKTQHACYSHINYSVYNHIYHAVITNEVTDEHFLKQKAEIKSPTSNLVMLLIPEVHFQNEYSWT